MHTPAKDNAIGSEPRKPPRRGHGGALVITPLNSPPANAAAIVREHPVRLGGTQ
jgi:hypothetical protein